MPPRTMPSQRQKRLGAEVRKLRTAAGMTAEYAAALLGTDRAKLSNIESGIRNISAERVRTLATHCNCPDEEYVAALVAYTTSTRTHQGRSRHRARCRARGRRSRARASDGPTGAATLRSATLAVPARTRRSARAARARRPRGP